MSKKRSDGVVVVFDRFPEPSERFLHRELRELALRGRVHGLMVLQRKRTENLPAPIKVIVADEVSPVDWFRGVFSLSLWVCALVAGLALGPGALAFLIRRAALLARVSRRSHGASRVHSAHAGWCGLAGWVLSRMLKKPFSFSCHARDVFVQRRLLRFLASRADRITVCNTAAHAELKKLTEVRGKVVELIRHPLPVLIGVPPRESVSLSFLAVGRPVEKKDFPALLTAFAAVRKAHPTATLDIAGATEQELGGPHEGVTAHGLVSFKRVAALMLRSSALVHASRVAADGDRDGLPNAIVEAMMLGVPVIASDAGAIGDLVEDRVTGRLVPQADPVALERAMLEHIGCPRESEQWAIAASARAHDQHSTANTVDRLEAFLFPSA